MPTQPLRFAIFECDHSLDPDRSQYGGYGGLIENWLKTNPTLRDRVEITIYDVEVEKKYPPPGVDAILISGSPTSVNSDAPWIQELLQFLKDIISQDKPTKLIGLCFGHQIIGKAMGARVRRSDQGFATSTTEIKLSPEGKKIFSNQDQISINMMHSDMVIDLPEGALCIGSTDFCAIQGFCIPGKLWTVQGHPEFDASIMKKIIGVMGAHGELTPEETQDALDRNLDFTDSSIVLDSLAEFLLN